MASRTSVTLGIMIAQLDGRVRYHLEHKTRYDVALTDLRAVGAPPEIVQEVADSARAAYLADPAFSWQDGDVARLLDGLLLPYANRDMDVRPPRRRGDGMHAPCPAGCRAARPAKR